jgi:hypothetical protein
MKTKHYPFDNTVYNSTNVIQINERRQKLNTFQQVYVLKDLESKVPLDEMCVDDITLKLRHHSR